MSKPKKCISVQEARELQKNWKSSRGKAIDRAQGFQDTREFWLSIEELEEYLKYVKEKSVEQEVENPGIRIYFGAYPPAAQNRGYSTVFLAPTKKSGSVESTVEDENVNNYDIDPLNQTSGGVPPTEY